jgi:DNA-binding response OmpR family regulator
LVDAALDPAQDSSRRTLDVHISRLRSKLGNEAAQLETVWGIGYRLSEGS